MIRFDVVSLFPEMFAAVCGSGIPRRAREDGLWKLAAWNPRDFTSDNHRSVDERPYGGGPGMVMLCEPLEQAIRAAREAQGGEGLSGKVILLSPQGTRLDHRKVLEFSRAQAVTLVCGRYEGVDERLIRRSVDEEVSIGDYVLSGGELAAMVLIDCVVRQLPGALGDARSAAEESFADGLLDCPQYTRPEIWPSDRGERVPEVLLSGNHAAIDRWRRKQVLGRTWERRPELLEAHTMTNEERKLLEEFQREHSERSMT